MSGAWFERFVQGTGFLQKYPFYAAVLAQLEVLCTDGVEVMAVRYTDGRFHLLVNEDWFEAHPDYRAGVLLHEVHHIVLGHLVLPRFRDVAQPLLLQLAMEMSANEYIAEPLPGPILWRDYTWVGIGPDQSTMERHHRLCRHRKRLELQLERLQGWLDDHGDGGAQRHGMGIAQLTRGEVDNDGAHAALRLLLERAERMRQQLAQLTPPSPPGHPGSGGKLLGDRTVDGLLRELGPAQPSPPLDWRAQLRRFVHRAPTRVWHRPDRRQPHRLMEVPGRGRQRHRPRVLCAIDTSASMTTGELRLIANELAHLSQRAEVTVAECDCRVHLIYRYTDTIHCVRGNGGTDLRPPFANELLQQHGHDGVVYFTDGQGPWPTEPPAVPVLWVLVQHLPFACPWGARTHLRREAPAGADLPF